MVKKEPPSSCLLTGEKLLSVVVVEVTRKSEFFASHHVVGPHVTGVVSEEALWRLKTLRWLSGNEAISMWHPPGSHRELDFMVWLCIRRVSVENPDMCLSDRNGGPESQQLAISDISWWAHTVLWAGKKVSITELMGILELSNNNCLIFESELLGYSIKLHCDVKVLSSSEFDLRFPRAGLTRVYHRARLSN